MFITSYRYTLGLYVNYFFRISKVLPSNKRVMIINLYVRYIQYLI